MAACLFVAGLAACTTLLGDFKAGDGGSPNLDAGDSGKVETDARNDVSVTGDSTTADSTLVSDSPEATAPDADAGADAGPHCTIGGVSYPAAATANSGCEVCDPAMSTSEWTLVNGVAQCASGQVCGNAGSCVPGCFVSGVFYAPGATQNTGCETCAPAQSTTMWTNAAPGTTCGGGQVCSGGVCGTQCAIADAGVVASGALNPSDPCESCQPGTSTSDWTSTSGINSTCASGQVCNGTPATCQAGCYIQSSFVPPNGTPAGNPCQSCLPGTTVGSYTSTPGVNASCPAGDVCTGTPAACAAGCWISGAYYASGATANSGCEVCSPAASVSSWTDMTGSATCPSGQVCNAGACQAGCDIAGTFQPAGATANSGCEICSPATSTSGWTNAAAGTSCGANDAECSNGSCTPIHTTTLGTLPVAIAYDNVHNNIWVANANSQNLTEINVATGAKTTFAGGSYPSAILFDGTSIWVGQQESSSNLVQVNPVTGVIENTFSVNSFVAALGYDGTYLWAGANAVNTGDTVLTKLTNTGSIVATYSGSSYGTGVQSFVYAGGFLWVGVGGSLLKVDTATGAVAGTYSPLGTGIPRNLVSDGTNIWMSCSTSFNVTKVSIATGAVSGTYLSMMGLYTTIGSDGTFIWASDLEHGVVTQINIATGATGASFPIGMGPTASVVGGGYVWVVNQNDAPPDLTQLPDF
jgi:hypothetical protein